MSYIDTFCKLISVFAKTVTKNFIKLLIWTLKRQITSWSKVCKIDVILSGKNTNFTYFSFRFGWVTGALSRNIGMFIFLLDIVSSKISNSDFPLFVTQYFLWCWIILFLNKINISDSKIKNMLAIEKIQNLRFWTESW